MRLKKFNCENLGGLRRQELEFSPGLNVLLGPNEAGKSTIVEGILATLFRSHRKRNTALDREFEGRFRPYPYGDSMKCQLLFAAAGEEYLLTKEWGGNPQLELSIQGQLLKDEKRILAKLQELLLYGEGTYTNVVFARQQDLRTALEKLQADGETSQELGDILHQAVMVLDGISLEKLKKRIDEEIASLQGHWDVEHNRPEKGRGWEDPWRSGRGTVLDWYYKTEELRSRIHLARQREDEYSAAVEKMKEIVRRREQVRTMKNKYAALEEDISQRLLLETELYGLEKEIQELKEIIQHKPAKEAELASKKQEMERLAAESQALRKELALAQRIDGAKNAKELLERRARLREAWEKKLQEYRGYPPVEEQQVKRLEELHNLLTGAKAALKAATLQASLKRTPKPVYITRGLKDRETIAGGCEFSASGFFRLESEDGLELEVRAGQIDFDALKEEFTRHKAEYTAILQGLQLKDLVEVKKVQALRYQLAREMQVLETQLGELEKGRDLADLQEEVRATEGLHARPQEELNRLLGQAEKNLQETSLQAALLQNILETWEKKYGDLGKLLDTYAQRSGVLEEKRKKLAALAPLPPEFSSAAAFKEELNRLRALDENLAEEERQAQKECFEKEKNLPEVTLEELQGLYQQGEAEFNRHLHRLHKLLLIRKVFQEKIAELAKDSYRPLIASFSAYLERLTLNKYSLGAINESLEVKLMRQDQVLMPSHLLSTGTSDAVTLALRLALIETLFPENEGLLILDDCLVNLDPGRKEKAAQVLREFASRYQVIFTTCDPATAHLLGGHTLTMS